MAVLLFCHPPTAMNKLVPKVAQVCDGSAKRGHPECQKCSKDLNRAC